MQMSTVTISITSYVIVLIISILTKYMFFSIYVAIPHCVNCGGNVASMEVNGDIEDFDLCGGEFLREIEFAMFCVYVGHKIVQKIKPVRPDSKNVINIYVISKRFAWKGIKKISSSSAMQILA